MLDGHMLHEDHLGNRGHLKSGGVQWMTAGRGIIHSEMPQQESGRMRGFQLWINLPSGEKMKPASYRDLDASEIPEVALASGGRVRVVAGVAEVDGTRTAGPIAGLSHRAALPRRGVARPRDLRPPGEGRAQRVPVPLRGHAGARRHDAAHARRRRARRARATWRCTRGAEGARFLLLAAKPLHEPVVQYGPFVMNTRDEIEQAIRDYQGGAFGRA